MQLLIDTCVWFELARDYRQRPTIAELEGLVKAEVGGLMFDT